MNTGKIFFENGKAEFQKILKVEEGKNYCEIYKILAKVSV